MESFMSFFRGDKPKSLDGNMNDFSHYLAKIGIINIRKTDQPSRLFIGNDKVITPVHHIVFPDQEFNTIAVFAALKSGINIQSGTRRNDDSGYIIEENSLLTLPWHDEKHLAYTSDDLPPLLCEATLHILTQDCIIQNIKAAGQNGLQSPLILKQHPDDPYGLADALRERIKDSCGYIIPVLPAAQHWASTLTTSFGRMVHGQKSLPPVKDFKSEQRERHQAIIDNFMGPIKDAARQDPAISGLGDTLNHLAAQAAATLGQSRIDIPHMTTQERSDLMRTFTEMQMLSPHMATCSDQDRQRVLETLCERFSHVLDTLEQKRIQGVNAQIDTILNLRTPEN